MDARTLAELRSLAAHVMDQAHRLHDGADELHRRLSAAEDAEQSRVEQVAKVRRLADERRRLRETTP